MPSDSYFIPELTENKYLGINFYLFLYITLVILINIFSLTYRMRRSPNFSLAIDSFLITFLSAHRCATRLITSPRRGKSSHRPLIDFLSIARFRWESIFAIEDVVIVANRNNTDAYSRCACYTASCIVIFLGIARVFKLAAPVCLIADSYFNASVHGVTQKSEREGEKRKRK